MVRIRDIFKGKLYIYSKYHTLTPTIKYQLPFEHKMERRLLYKDKAVSTQDVMKHIRNKDNIVIVQGEDGLGKTTLLKDMAKMLREIDRLNILEFEWPKQEFNRVREDLFQLSKNIVFLDNVELCEAEALSMLEKIRSHNVEVSFCLATADDRQANYFKNRFSSLQVIEVRLLPFDF